MTEKGKSLIRQFEGCSLVAYLCPSKKWTIGYGNTFYADGTPVKEGDKIDQATANQLFDIVLQKFEIEVRGILGNTLCAILPKESIDALISFAYNCGVGSLSKSTLLKKVKTNKNDLVGIKAEFAKWNKSNGKVLNGLTRRRNAEAEMYIDGIASQYTKREIIKMFAGV